MNHPIEEIILASGSPRRKELLQRIGIPFRVVKSECEEITTKTEPCDVVMELSQQKAFDVYSKLSEAERKDSSCLYRCYSFMGGSIGADAAEYVL